MRNTISIFLIVFIVRTSFLFLYFLLVETGIIDQWTLFDDLGYIENLSDNFYKLDNKMNIENLRATAGGYNSFYYVIIFYSFKLFGESYFSPVIINSILFSLAICFLTKYYVKDKKWFFLILLNPDILIWTSLFNLKEALIFSTFILIILSAQINSKLLKIIFLSLSLFLIFNTRFYYVPIALLAYLIFKLFYVGKVFRNHFTIIYLIFLLVITTIITNNINIEIPKYTNPFYGFIHFLLTPLPWNISDNYSFLLLGSFINPFIIIYFFFKKSRIKHLNIIDIFIILLFIFYSISDELQGPRHKSALIMLILISLTNEKEKYKNYFTSSLKSIWWGRKKLKT